MKRYSSRKFPPYAYIPRKGKPHPVENPKGHSFRKKPEEVAPLFPEKWGDNEIYLFGVDLYNHGFFWEAHEAWERLWQLSDKQGEVGCFLAGLIQYAAFLLKLKCSQPVPALRLAKEGLAKLHALSHKKFCGLNLWVWRKEAEAFLTRTAVVKLFSQKYPRMDLESAS